MHKHFWLKGLKERDLSENLGVDGDNIKINLREMGLEYADCIYLA
jgi:hypothetical protein